MQPPPPTTWIAFAQRQRIAFGAPRDMAAALKAFVQDQPDAPVLVFDAVSSQPIEVDLRGRVGTVLARVPAPAVPGPPNAGDAADAAPRGPGRPKLGVVAREVTLLPRHWDWLATQPGGASVALRKLVESAQRASVETDRRRAATESAYRFMHAMAGDERGFEEASRALFAGDLDALKAAVERWPADVRLHVLELAGRAIGTDSGIVAPRPDGDDGTAGRRMRR